MGWISTRGLVACLTASVCAASVQGALAPDAEAVLLEGGYARAAERREGHNPSLGSKLVGYHAWVRANGGPADVAIVGTSRAVQLDPRLVRRLSGRTAYNFGTSDGAAREFLAVGGFVELLTPRDVPHLVVLFDIEALDRRRPTRRVVKVIRASDAARAACPEPARCAGAWNLAARRIVASARVGIRDIPSARATQRADGMQVNGLLERWDREGVDLAAVRDRRIAIRVRSYRPGGGFDRLMPVPMAATAKLLRQANARGDRPTIVLTSMHPECIRRCGPAGWFARRAATLAMFDRLAQQYEFTLLNRTNPASWGGSAASFFDEIHLRPAAAAQFVRHLHAAGAFDVEPGARPTAVAGAVQAPRASGSFLTASVALVGRAVSAAAVG